MADIQVQALVTFANATLSMYAGEVKTLAEDVATPLITAGFVESYTEPIVPTGAINIEENGEYNVTSKATANVNVPQPIGSISIDGNGTVDVTNYVSAVVNISISTITYNANGGTGTIVPLNAIKGDVVNLSDGTGLTPPDTKTFAGWATTNDAETPNVTSPYTVTGNATLYAVYS